MPLDPNHHPYLSSEVLAEAEIGTASTKVMPPMEVAYTYHVGSYGEIAPAFERLVQWIEANGYEVAGPPGNRYIDDPDTTPENELITEVFCPIVRKTT